MAGKYSAPEPPYVPDSEDYSWPGMYPCKSGHRQCTNCGLALEAANYRERIQQLWPYCAIKGLASLWHYSESDQTQVM